MRHTVIYGARADRPAEVGVPFGALTVGDFFFMDSERNGELWMKYSHNLMGTPADGYRTEVDQAEAIVFPAEVTITASRVRP